MRRGGTSRRPKGLPPRRRVRVRFQSLPLFLSLSEVPGDNTVRAQRGGLASLRSGVLREPPADTPTDRNLLQMFLWMLTLISPIASIHTALFAKYYLALHTHCDRFHDTP